MKYWFGYLVAAIFGAITYVLMAFGDKFATLVDMVYPYVIRTYEGMMAQWASTVSFPIWQLLAVALGVVILATLILVIILKWNPIQWLGWVAAVFAGIYMLHTLMWGLNYYAGPIAEDMRLDTSSYTLSELTEATEYYRDMANDLSTLVPRDAAGNVDFGAFETMAAQAGNGFENLTYQRHYSVFAGSRLPVKELGWADMYTSMGITGVTFGLTGEACVNPQIPDVCLPFTMCHEMAHRMCIATERDANFAAFLAGAFNDDIAFRYSAYFMAYEYCYSALNSVRNNDAAAAAASISGGVGEQLQRDMLNYTAFFRTKQDAKATKFADTVNDTYLKTSGSPSGLKSYGEVCDLLVNWHIQEVVLPSMTVEESPFDPYDESQVDLSDILAGR